MSQLLSRDNENLSELLLCREKDKISTELDGETVILDLASGIYSGLDPVGTIIWNMLETPVAFKEIAAEILSRYAVSEEQCSSDLLDFIGKLSSNNLIVIQDVENQ